MNLHVFLSPFLHESRALKEAESLVQGGLFSRVLFVAIWEKGLARRERVDERCEVWRVRLKTRGLPKGLVAQTIKYLEWLVRILWLSKREPVRVVHAHSLAALPAAVLLKLFHGAKLVYDAHELETEKYGLHGARKSLSRLVERALIRFADVTLVVSEAIAAWYEREYRGCRALVILNVPRKAGTPAANEKLLRERLGIGPDEILFIHQGGLAPGRGIERLLRVFTGVNRSRHLVFMGSGPLDELVEDHARRFPHIHHHPPVRPSDVLKFTAGADVGVALIENACTSYYYCLPNKFFEYLLAGLPVVVPPFPEMARIVREYDCGWTVEDDDPSLLRLLDTLSRESITQKQAAAEEARTHLDWEMEEKKLLAAYRDLLER